MNFQSPRFLPVPLVLLLLILGGFARPKPNTSSIVHAADSTLITVHEGWNMISLPLIVPYPNALSIFPHASSKLYSYEGTYRRHDTLDYGRGYWLKFPATETLSVTGIKANLLITKLAPGWNMIGAPSFPVQVTDIMVSPATSITSPYYSYSSDSGYRPSGVLQPGSSYWVKTQGGGMMSDANWEFLGLGNEQVTSMAAHPYDPNIVYCGTGSDFSEGHNGGIFKTTDGGVSWDTLVVGGSYSSVVIDPIHPETLYAAPGTLIMSLDGGKTWRYRADSIFLTWETRVVSIAIDPKNPNILYAGTGGPFGGTIYRSSNSGLLWSDVSQGDGYLQAGIAAIAIDPINSSTVYVGSAAAGSISKTTNSGHSWTFLAGFTPTGTTIEPIIIDPKNSDKVIIGAGRYGFSVTTDGGANWAWYNDGIPTNSPAQHMIMDPISLDYYGIVSHHMYRRGPNENEWIRIGIVGVDSTFGYCSIALRSDLRYLYFGGQGVYRLSLTSP